MSIKTLAQMRQEIAAVTQAGIVDYSNGTADFDLTTYPTKPMVNLFINECIREITSSWDYTFKETSNSYQFYHTISGVQSLSLYNLDPSGVAFASGTITPYPSEVLNYTWFGNNSVNELANNYSGIAYVGLSGTTPYSGISDGGNISYVNYNTVGRQYQLNNDIDKIIAVGITHSHSGNTGQGILMNQVDWKDIERTLPVGINVASGTPICYSEFPGLSPSNNKVIQFFPAPDVAFSGETFFVHYNKKHVDLVNDTDQQNIIPEQWQNIITQAVTERIYDMLDNPKSQMAQMKKMDLEGKMRVWDANQPNKTRKWEQWQTSNISNRLFDNSQVVYLP